MVAGSLPRCPSAPGFGSVDHRPLAPGPGAGMRTGVNMKRTSGPRPTRRQFVAGVAGAAGVAGLSAACTNTAINSPSSATIVRDPIPSDRQGFNRRWFAPNLQRVYVPTSMADIADAVGSAIAEFGSATKVVGGRHCYEGFVYDDSTQAVIDMSAMTAVGYDEAKGAYFAEAGCQLWDVYRGLLNGYGRTLPAGSCYSVGAGGHISGGGYGLLSRLRGMVVDHLTAVDIVTWDANRRQATLRYVSPESADAAERDLFWALTGAGGGNFGVIARYYFADPPTAPQEAAIWTLKWDWSTLTLESFQGLLRDYAAFVAQLPAEAFSLLKLNHAAAGQITLLVQYSAATGGTSNGGQAPPAPAFPTSRPASTQLERLTFFEAQQTLNGSGPNQFGKYKSAYTATGFSDRQVAVIYDWLQRVPAGTLAPDMSQSLLQVDSFGGAINDVPADATAFPHRGSQFALQYQTYWTNDSAPGATPTEAAVAESEAHLSWIRGFYDEMYAETGGVPTITAPGEGGCYYNYPDTDLGTAADGDLDQALTLYFGDNYRNNPRNLVAVKQQWDPTDVFRHAQSIPPT